MVVSSAFNPRLATLKFYFMAQTTLGNMKVYEVSHDYSIDGLSINERKVPTPLAHQVLVRLQAVSLNYRDLLIIK